MGQVIILKGLPASGKSTWARQYMGTRSNVKRVNKDDLRDMIDDSVWSQDREKFILRVRDEIIKQALTDGYDVIVDDTNLSPKHERRIRSIIPKGHEVIVIDNFLSLPIEECIKRDENREMSVGSKVIIDMYKKYLSDEPLTREQKTELWLSTKKKKYPVIEYDPSLPDAIIVDIDGTIAKMTGRSPFDYTKVSTDTPNWHVIDRIYELVDIQYFRDLSRRYLFLVSGREGTSQCYEDTRKWLESYSIFYDSLLMRPEGDHRKDVEIKKEIYEEYIKGKYNVLAVFDDRDQTVKGYRELGLQVFQVADGDF